MILGNLVLQTYASNVFGKLGKVRGFGARLPTNISFESGPTRFANRITRRVPASTTHGLGPEKLECKAISTGHAANIFKLQL